MNLLPFFKSVLEQDRAPVVLCDLENTIVYMNRAAAERYSAWGGTDLLGKSLLVCHNEKSGKLIDKAVKWFSENTEHNTVYESRNEKENKDVYIVALRDDNKNLIGYYEKHEYRDCEAAGFYDFTE